MWEISLGSNLKHEIIIQFSSRVIELKFAFSFIKYNRLYSCKRQWLIYRITKVLADEFLNHQLSLTVYASLNKADVHIFYATCKQDFTELRRKNYVIAYYIHINLKNSPLFNNIIV